MLEKDYVEQRIKFVMIINDFKLLFQVLPIVIFFSTFISMLYYLGVMQVLIKKIAIVMQILMGTTAGESLNAAGNIFIGQVNLFTG